MARAANRKSPSATPSAAPSPARRERVMASRETTRKLGPGLVTPSSRIANTPPKLVQSGAVMRGIARARGWMCYNSLDAARRFRPSPRPLRLFAERGRDQGGQDRGAGAGGRRCRRWRSPTPAICSARWNSARPARARACSRSSAARSRWRRRATSRGLAPDPIVLLAQDAAGLANLQRLSSLGLPRTPIRR